MIVINSINVKTINKDEKIRIFAPCPCCFCRLSNENLTKNSLSSRHRLSFLLNSPLHHLVSSESLLLDKFRWRIHFSHVLILNQWEATKNCKQIDAVAKSLLVSASDWIQMDDSRTEHVRACIAACAAWQNEPDLWPAYWNGTTVRCMHCKRVMLYCVHVCVHVHLFRSVRAISTANFMILHLWTACKSYIY